MRASMPPTLRGRGGRRGGDRTARPRRVRVAEPTDDGWVVNGWAKQAVLLYFRVRGLDTLECGPFEYHDRLPLKTGTRRRASAWSRPPLPAAARSFLQG